MSLSCDAQKPKHHKWLAFFAFTACVGLCPCMVSAQAKCTATASVIAPMGTWCAGNQWGVTGSEQSGPHPGRQLNFGLTPMLYGVCPYSYPPCSLLQTAESVTVEESDVLVNAPSVSVSSSGVITVTVTTIQPSATANPTPCKCTDENPQGYTAVSAGAPTVKQVVMNVQQC